ncbi:hypothetical protein [Tenacibaculum aquimarinum]|uniref:hypothetical protein n=1 Tax=Tenacibaculum aquimarinum TaxID=2910675 RepID=UPI001F0B25E6|nr:hypothetical protein [Tenacibaculum aquimarinum]MCH3885924.1 hypothetical protein [Tenacibaculum aquimarinum]
MNINENFKHNINVNQWAFIKHLRAEKISIEVLKGFKGNHYTILFFIIDLYVRKGIIKINIYGSIYAYMSTNLFINNLPIVFYKNEIEINKIEKKLKSNLFKTNGEREKYIKKLNQLKNKEYNRLNRNLQNYLKVLINNGLVDVEIVNRNKRYIKVNSRLLRLCNKGKDKLTPLEYVEKNFNNDLMIIKNKYIHLLPQKRYAVLKCKFFNNEYVNQLQQKNYTIDKFDILFRFEEYLKPCVKDPYFKEHRKTLDNY